MSRIVRYLNKNWVVGGTENFFKEEPIDESVTDIISYCENICQTKVCNNENCNKQNCGISVSHDNEFYHYKNLPTIQ
jgi:hypothetical protein